MFIYNGYYLEVTPDKNVPTLLNGECPEAKFFYIGNSYDSTIEAFKTHINNYVVVKKEVDKINISNLVATFRAKAKKTHQKYHEAKKLNDTIFGVNLYQQLVEEMIETIEELTKEKTD